MFLNLVVNAAQAIAEGRAEDNEIRVSTFMDPTRESSAVVIEIADTGPGIAPEVMGHLFTPFFTTKPVGVGTGLGLSICHRIVTGFGGSIDAKSELGKGTTFRIVLPAAPSERRASVPDAPIDVTTARRGRILIVDDDPMVLKMLQRVLSAEHDAIAVGGGDAALARIVGGECFDVILCDLMMPQMTGMDLHAELMGVSAEHADRMVFLTGGAFTDGARAFLDVVPNEKIEKPFDLMRLRALINTRIR